MIRGFRCDLKNDSKDKNDVYNILLDEHLQANIDNYKHGTWASGLRCDIKNYSLEARMMSTIYF